MKQKTHKYQLVIEFESEKPVSKHADHMTQFENGLGYFVETPSHNLDSINQTFVYGTGKARLKKVSK